MAGDNRERMVKLAEDFFRTKDDPDQIPVDQDVIVRLRSLHPATVTEERTEDGPIAWILVIPTTRGIMNEFITAKISERDLLAKTPAGVAYDALYLCSALVLPEYRGKGLARRLTAQAIDAIRRDHPIGALFFWSFGNEGEKLAATAASDSHLPLFERAPGAGPKSHKVWAYS